MRVIVLAASTETVLEVLVVLVALSCFLRMNAAVGSRHFVYAKSAWRCLRQAGCSAVADKVALVEKLNEYVFAVAGYGA